MSDPKEMNARLGIPGIAEIVTGQGGLTAVKINAAQGASASGMVYLHGAHVTSWQPLGQSEVLFLSSKSAFEDAKPIRGGVPLIFPWFGNRSNPPALPALSPMHGFVRLTTWSLDSIQQSANSVTITLSTKSTDQTRATWPHDFLLKHHITFGQELTMAYEVANTGKNPFTAELAQHTYFQVGDARKVRVIGLDGVHYIDKVDGFKEKQQQGDIHFTAETDRVYLDTATPVTIEDPTARRRITVHKDNSRNTVVWNPAPAKAATLADLGPNQWINYACVETCNIGPFAFALKAGETRTMTTRVEVQPL